MNLETEETITVTSEAPMVDKFNVSAGATVTSEVGAQAAGTTRTYYGVINMLPGVTSDADNRDISEMRPSVNGGHFADQRSTSTASTPPSRVWAAAASSCPPPPPPR